MKDKKEKLYLSNLSEASKNPSPNKYVLVYTENEDEEKSVKKPRDRVTLRQVVNMIKAMDAKIDAGFKQVNTRIDKIDARLDYIVKANNLKDLPKSKQ